MNRRFFFLQCNAQQLTVFVRSFRGGGSFHPAVELRPVRSTLELVDVALLRGGAMPIGGAAVLVETGVNMVGGVLLVEW